MYGKITHMKSGQGAPHLTEADLAQEELELSPHRHCAPSFLKECVQASP